MVAAGKDDAFHAGQARRLEHVEQAARVDPEEVFQREGADDAGQVHDRLHALHHGFEGRTVGDIGDDQILVGGRIRHGPDVGQPEMAPSVAQAHAQRRADRTRRACDQHAIGLGSDHGALSANAGITSAASSSSVSTSFL